MESPKPERVFLIRLGVTTEQIADAGAEIAEVVLRGLSPHQILKVAIEEAEETVARVKITQRSKLAGLTLQKLRYMKKQECGYWQQGEVTLGFVQNHTQS